jgi:hypothetical protein
MIRNLNVPEEIDSMQVSTGKRPNHLEFNRVSAASVNP